MTNPIIIEFEDGREYTLEFSRESVTYAEAHGFSRTDVTDKMMIRLPELFYYAFRKNHPTVKKETTDKILFDELGGMSPELSARLVELFNAPYESLVNEDGTPKNPKVTVHF